jgi:hypothetical protein
LSADLSDDAQPGGRLDDDTIAALLEKTDRALEDATYLLRDDRVEAAINRSYYAAFHVARAALLTRDETPSSHAGVLTRFSYHFVRTGRVPEEIARALARAETDRNRADYDAFSVFDARAAEDLIGEVQRFVEAARHVIAEERRR